MTSSCTRPHYEISEIIKACYITIYQIQNRVYKFLYLARGASENIFEVKSLAH